MAKENSIVCPLFLASDANGWNCIIAFALPINLRDVPSTVSIHPEDS